MRKQKKSEEKKKATGKRIPENTMGRGLKVGETIRTREKGRKVCKRGEGGNRERESSIRRGNEKRKRQKKKGARRAEIRGGASRKIKKKPPPPKL